MSEKKMLCGFEIEVSEFRLFNRFTCHIVETLSGWLTAFQVILSQSLSGVLGNLVNQASLHHAWSCVSSGPPSSPSPCHAPNAHWAPVVQQQTDWIKKEGKSGQDLLTNMESGSKARFIHGNTKGHDRKGTWLQVNCVNVRGVVGLSI